MNWRAFVACLRLDAREGWAALWKWYAGSLVLFTVLCLALHLDMGDRAEGAFSLGDYLVSFVAGMEPYVFSYSKPFRFPITWGLLVAYSSFVTLWFPYRDLMGMGSKVIVATKSRWSWWLSKCLWVALATALFWACGIAVALAFAVGGGGAISFDVSPAVPAELGFSTNDLVQSLRLNGMLFCMGIPGALIAVNVVQLALSLFVRPVVAYTTTVGSLVLSLFVPTPWLLGNELMAARSVAFVLSGTSIVGGLVVSAMLSAAAILAGGAWFMRMDVVDKEGFE